MTFIGNIGSALTQAGNAIEAAYDELGVAVQNEAIAVGDQLGDLSQDAHELVGDTIVCAADAGADFFQSAGVFFGGQLDDEGAPLTGSLVEGAGRQAGQALKDAGAVGRDAAYGGGELSNVAHDVAGELVGLGARKAIEREGDEVAAPFQLWGGVLSGVDTLAGA